ncbi:MAG: hypothetical protein LC667_07075 [Thioalkalivibrio sp.]|nr:hypothetical protein [Thioalkalivibrio sp.]
MIHSRDTSLLDAVLLGRVPISRLDGENWFWWDIATGEPEIGLWAKPPGADRAGLRSLPPKTPPQAG